MFTQVRTSCHWAQIWKHTRKQLQTNYKAKVRKESIYVFQGVWELRAKNNLKRFWRLQRLTRVHLIRTCTELFRNGQGINVLSKDFNESWVKWKRSNLSDMLPITSLKNTHVVTSQWPQLLFFLTLNIIQCSMCKMLTWLMTLEITEFLGF